MRAGALLLAETLQKAGYIAYWAGGCVRDVLMNRPPKDYDIATNASPDQILRLFPRSIAVGKAFGVIRTPCQGHYYEIAAFRKDLSYKDGRRPTSVTFTDAEQDAQRRDFTINALFYDPLKEQILDYVDGQKDIAAKIMRAVGNPPERFAEDHLRLLRAVRFATTLNFTIEPKTFQAIVKHADKLARISVERIQIEFTRTLLESDQAGDALELLADLGLLKHIVKEALAMRGQAQPPQFHPEGDVFTHTALMLNALPPDASSQLAWAVLLHDIGKPPTCRLVDGRLRFNQHATVGANMAEKIMKRLRMSNSDIKIVTHAIKNHMRFMDVRRMRRATLLHMVSAETFPLELELHRLDCLASHGNLDNYNFLLNFIQTLAEEPKLPPPLLSGHDLLKLGLQGSEIGHWKKAAYDAQLNKNFDNLQSGLNWLKAQLQQPNLELKDK